MIIEVNIFSCYLLKLSETLKISYVDLPVSPKLKQKTKIDKNEEKKLAMQENYRKNKNLYANRKM